MANEKRKYIPKYHIGQTVGVYNGHWFDLGKVYKIIISDEGCKYYVQGAGICKEELVTNSPRKIIDAYNLYYENEVNILFAERTDLIKKVEEAFKKNESSSKDSKE